jgi:predicted porin
MKISSGKLDLFADTVADYNAFISDLRVDGAIAYVSPNLNGLTLIGALVQHPLGTEDLFDAYSLAGIYTNGPFFVSLAYEMHESDYDKNIGTSVAGAVGQDSQWRLGLGLMDMAGFTASFVYEQRDGIGQIDGSDDDDDNDIGDFDVDGGKSTAYYLAGAYDIGMSRIKAMYGMIEWEQDNNDIANVDSDADGEEEFEGTYWAIGYQYNLSKRTDVEVIYTQYNEEETNSAEGDESSEEFDGDVLSFQMNHAF